MRSIKKLEEIIRQMKRDFPKIKDKKIIAKYVRLPYFFLTSSSENRSCTIEVDSYTMTNVSKRVIVGGLAHELAHLQIDESLRGLAKNLDAKRYNTSKVYKRAIERNADVEAISRGYGRELYSFGRFEEKYRKKKRGKSYGLTIKEIRKLVYKR